MKIKIIGIIFTLIAFSVFIFTLLKNNKDLEEWNNCIGTFDIERFSEDGYFKLISDVIIQHRENNAAFMIIHGDIIHGDKTSHIDRVIFFDYEYIFNEHTLLRIDNIQTKIGINDNMSTSSESMLKQMSEKSDDDFFLRKWRKNKNSVTLGTKSAPIFTCTLSL